MVAGILRGMMAMDTQRAVMLGQRRVPDHEEIATRASNVRTCAWTAARFDEQNMLWQRRVG